MKARLRRSIRARLVASLVLACAVTLAAASLILLLPLEHRLRVNELSYLKTSGYRAARAFDALPESAFVTPRLLRPVRLRPLHRFGDFNHHPSDADVLAHQVARLTRSRVVVLDRRGRSIADTDRDGAPPLPIMRRALVSGRMVSALSGRGAEAVARVAIPLRHGRYVLALVESLRRVGSTAATVRSGIERAAAIALATAVALGLAIAAGLSRRLRRLRDGALSVAERGIDADLPHDPVPDEIGDLAGAFRLMQTRLRRQEEARQAFVGTASHELRTPLATLNGNLELLELELSVPEPDIAAARDEARRARSQAKRLASLATDLLELSRLDAGVEPSVALIEVTATARSVLSEFASRAAGADVRLVLDVPRKPVFATSDPNRLAQIVRILVDNALRFAPRDSAVIVRVARVGGNVHVSVSDSGPGVPESERELIFQRFRRGTKTGGDAGFGLGLAIGRELAERMGGSLTLETSTQPGATFLLSVPGAVADDAPAAIPVLKGV